MEQISAYYANSFLKRKIFAEKLYLCTRIAIKNSEDMEARTAQQLIDAAKPAKKGKRHYRHEALCGVFSSGATEEELLEDYLKEFENKYL